MHRNLIFALLGSTCLAKAAAAQTVPPTQQPRAQQPQTTATVRDACDRLISWLERAEGRAQPGQVTLAQARRWDAANNFDECRRALQSLRQAQATERGRIVVQQQAPQIAVNQVAPRITVRQPESR